LSLDNPNFIPYDSQTKEEIVRKKHPDKDIESALYYAESKGWRIIERRGHAWGSLVCPKNSEDCRCGQFCQMSIWSSPRSAGNHARQLIQKVDGCIYYENDE